MAVMELFHANIVYSKNQTELAVYTDSYLGVEDGKVAGIWEKLPAVYEGLPVTECGHGVLIPAFSDLHVHAPQYLNRGLNMDLLLADWLSQLTFPMEARFADPDFAKMVYGAFLDDMLANGTVHACIFGTIHRPACSWLLEEMNRRGMKGFVGKVNMDRSAQEDLLETPEESLRETEAFLEAYANNRFARPILTPRFAPTCTAELIGGLGRLGQKYGVGVQTHLVESRWEAEQARLLFPDCSCDTEIYEKAGLMDNGPVIGAHFIFPSEDDERIMQKHGGYVVHCPDATVNVIAGITPSGRLLDQGMKVTLGSDVSGGHHIGVYTQVARAVQYSKLKEFYEPGDNRTVSLAEAFYMATLQSGSLFGKVGSLAPGYDFDALLIDGLDDPARPLSPVQTLERFCYIGNSANIKARWLSGRLIEREQETGV